MSCTYFFILLTVLLSGQDCGGYCNNIAFAKNFEIVNPERILECNCTDNVALKLDTFFSVAVQEEDIISQKLILNQMENVLSFNRDNPTTSTNFSQYIFNTGLYNKHINNLDLAEKKYNEVVSNLKNSYKNDPQRAELLSLALQQLAEISTSRSNFQKSINHLEYSIDLEKKRVEGTSQRPVTYSMLSRIGVNYSMMGKGEEALRYFRLGTEPMKEAVSHLSPERIKSLAYIFIGYFNLELEETLKLKKNKESYELLNIISKIQQPNHPRNKAINLLKAKYFTNSNNQDSASYYYKLSKDSIFASENNTTEKLNYYTNYAIFCETFKSPEDALLSLDTAIFYGDHLLATSTKWSRNMIHAKSEKIRLLHQLGRSNEALNLISLFAKEINQRLSGAVIFEDHINHINEFYPIFEIGLNIIEKEFPEKIHLAFDIIECTKSLSLYKSSLLTQNSKNSNQDSLILKFKTLNALASQYLLNQARGDSTIETSNNLYDTHKMIAEIKGKLLEESPFPKPLSISDYQSNIDRNKTHILSFSGADHYYFLSIESNKTKLVKVENTELDSLLKKYITEISTFQNNLFQESSEKIGVLLNKVLSDTKKEIIFSGDGYLDLIPIESIIMPDGNFLLNKKCISYSPSAKIQHLFNTGLPSEKLKTAIFRPSFNDDVMPLEYAEKECAAILKLMNGELFENGAASKDLFLTESEQFDILHLATHAKSINDDPSKSYINFTDSKLYFNEIRSMILGTELVCLSACETNSGLNFNGEGVQSLARNFIASGAKSVVSSLWQISDQTTSEITISFYKYLSKGYSKAEALQKSKIDFLEHHPDDGMHPYYWAGLVLTGNSDAITSNNKWKYLLGGSVLIFFIGLTAFKQFTKISKKAS
ncbi:CHAT domain-containing protein [Portibacter lacus]|uniref:CHAT domain-containing protein n=1 Tax=Portibacter lacus TaxID=1099794 RepID=UPI001F2AE5CF|nr:CHAT domain-containing protein [Portibacter lacus]